MGEKNGIEQEGRMATPLEEKHDNAVLYANAIRTLARGLEGVTYMLENERRAPDYELAPAEFRERVYELKQMVSDAERGMTAKIHSYYGLHQITW